MIHPDYELSGFYTSKFKVSDLHGLKIKSFDEVKDVGFKNWSWFSGS